MAHIQTVKELHCKCKLLHERFNKWFGKLMLVVYVPREVPSIAILGNNKYASIKQAHHEIRLALIVTDSLVVIMKIYQVNYVIVFQVL